MRSRAVACVVAVCVAVGATVAAGPIDRAASVDQPARRLDLRFRPELTPAERAATDLADLINLERNQLGLPNYLWDDRVAEAATVQSVAMADQGRLFHRDAAGRNAGDRLGDAGFAWRSWGEAVGAGFIEPAPLLAAWMASPDHRPQIVGTFRQFGVGVAVTDDGVTYWTLVVAL